MELLFIRHAEPRLVQSNDGPADPGLSELGQRQAEALAEWLHGEEVDVLLVSPLRRARETAEPLAARLQLEAVVTPGIAEFDAHASSYIPLEELKRTSDTRLDAMLGGRWDELGIELDMETFATDVLAAVGEIVSSHPGRRVAAVCHGGIINIYAGDVLGIERRFWFEPAYTSVSRVAVSRGGLRSVLSLNETGHLRNPRLLARP
jgi:probable phosphoglycerate mutase